MAEAYSRVRDDAKAAAAKKGEDQEATAKKDKEENHRLAMEAREQLKVSFAGFKLHETGHELEYSDPRPGTKEDNQFTIGVTDTGGNAGRASILLIGVSSGQYQLTHWNTRSQESFTSFETLKERVMVHLSQTGSQELAALFAKVTAERRDKQNGLPQVWGS